MKLVFFFFSINFVFYSIHYDKSEPEFDQIVIKILRSFVWESQEKTTMDQSLVEDG